MIQHLSKGAVRIPLQSAAPAKLAEWRSFFDDFDWLWDSVCILEQFQKTSGQGERFRLKSLEPPTLSPEPEIWVSQNSEYPFGGPYNYLGSILGSLYFGKLPNGCLGQGNPPGAGLLTSSSCGWTTKAAFGAPLALVLSPEYYNRLYRDNIPIFSSKNP